MLQPFATFGRRLPPFMSHLQTAHAARETQQREECAIGKQTTHVRTGAKTAAGQARSEDPASSSCPAHEARQGQRQRQRTETETENRQQRTENRDREQRQRQRQSSCCTPPCVSSLCPVLCLKVDGSIPSRNMLDDRRRAHQRYGGNARGDERGVKTRLVGRCLRQGSAHLVTTTTGEQQMRDVWLAVDTTGARARDGRMADHLHPGSRGSDWTTRRYAFDSPKRERGPLE